MHTILCMMYYKVPVSLVISCYTFWLNPHSCGFACKLQNFTCNKCLFSTCTQGVRSSCGWFVPQDIFYLMVWFTWSCSLLSSRLLKFLWNLVCKIIDSAIQIVKVFAYSCIITLYHLFNFSDHCHTILKTFLR